MVKNPDVSSDNNLKFFLIFAFGKILNIDDNV